MTIGIDIVETSTIEEMSQRSSSTILKMLTLGELETAETNIQKAGLIAAKEAIIKTGYVLPGEWLKISVSHLPSGKPVVLDARTHSQVMNLEISITHTVHYAAAVALYHHE
jgi:phosphopantetheine--protein transferase-like protein